MERPTALLLFLLLLLPALAAASRRTALVEPPPVSKWPESFSLSYNFSLPYTREFQSSELVYDVIVHRDADRRLAKQSLYSGSNVILATEETYYESTPRIDEVGCAAYKADDESAQLLDAPLLPDLTAVVGDGESKEPVWVFQGEERIAVASAGGDGTVLAGLWEARARHGERETVYRFWASSDGSEDLPLRPLRLHQQGPDMLSGSHFDEYIVDYGELVPGPPQASSFEKPQSCVGVEKGDEETTTATKEERGGARLAATAASLAPRLPCSKSSRRRRVSLSSAAPPSALEENAAFVARHNARLDSGGAASLVFSSSSSSVSSSPSYRVELNRFAPLSDAEFAATYLQSESLAARRQKRRKEERSEEGNGDEEEDQGLQSSKKKKKNHFSAELAYSRRVPRGSVPSAVDWRGTGAVSAAVKDQSTCGSCWAFGAAAALEGAAFLGSSGKSPSPVSVSEQQFMDCSWNYGSNSACGGGDADAAIDWLVGERRGEFEVERDYQYRGAAGFCKRLLPENSSLDSSSISSSAAEAAAARSARRVVGYAFVPRGDDDAVMEAVYSRGPLQVSIDAAAEGFRFYSSGVYDEPSCSPREEDLDHSIALVGYGTDEASGKDYWLVRNSWSSHWGDGGYVKIARANGGCGVGTAAMYAVMEEERDEGDEIGGGSEITRDDDKGRELSVA